MRLTAAKAALATALLFNAAGSVRAGSLQIEPVLVDVIAPAAASTLTLRNEGATAVDAQIRVFRWSLVNGQEKLEPTEDVVASPPAITLSPKGNYVARIVRVAKHPVVGEESYRLLVDQLPDLSRQKNGTVNLLVRYSIPVFFGTPEKKGPSVAWSLVRSGDKLKLIVRNNGERRLRISALTVRDAKGGTISFGAGLAGYSLGQSIKSWTAPGSARGFAADGPVSIVAESDTGPIRATASVSAAR
jgi:fimbrial chaperone protein